MFSLFTNKKETENDESHLSLISIAALLIHSAKIDQNFTEKERNIIKNALIEMGAAENTLDEILKGLVEDEISVEKIVSKGFDRKVVEKTSQLLARSEYKRFQAAPGPKVTNKAFGRDRRFPLTSGFRNWN